MNYTGIKLSKAATRQYSGILSVCTGKARPSLQSRRDPYELVKAAQNCFLSPLPSRHFLTFILNSNVHFIGSYVHLRGNHAYAPAQRWGSARVSLEPGARRVSHVLKTV